MLREPVRFSLDLGICDPESLSTVCPAIRCPCTGIRATISDPTRTPYVTCLGLVTFVVGERSSSGSGAVVASSVGFGFSKTGGLLESITVVRSCLDLLESLS